MSTPIVPRSISPYALIVSVGLHILLSLEMLGRIHAIVQPAEEQKYAELLLTAPQPRKEVARKQIAPPSQAPETKEVPKDARPSERNTAVEKESVRKGDDVLSPPSPALKEIRPQPQVAPQKSNQQKNTKRASPAPKEVSRQQTQSEVKRSTQPPVLRLGEGDLLARLGPGEAPAAKGSEANQMLGKKVLESQNKPSEQERAERFFRTAPFQRSSAFSLGNPGVSDLLHNVPDGEITLLNEKADQFAVFVRRVALQVFGILRRSSWGSLPSSEVDNILRYSEIRAILSPKGKFIRLEIVSNSGSRLFDNLLENAVEKGASDQNPPREAVAVDGNFHFIFLARTWSRRAPNGLPEQRWLVLGTGLE